MGGGGGFRLSRSIGDHTVSSPRWPSRMPVHRDQPTIPEATEDAISVSWKCFYFAVYSGGSGV